uniref:Dehydrogenase/reductase SDR family member 11 n=1 Tax=Mesocestoides corti TaxID=53468 RepID=A0A5K3FXG4_MESCO
MALEGKVCIVVGASTGIGRAIAIRCGKEGANVVLCARRKHLLDSLAEEVGRNATVKPMDVTNREQVEARISEIYKEFSRVDVLIYASSIFTFSLVKNKQFDEWHKMIATNCQIENDFVFRAWWMSLHRYFPKCETEIKRETLL